MQQNMTLFKYRREGSLVPLYRSAKKNAEQFGWHGLGDVVYVGARMRVSIDLPNDPILVIQS